eukprot:1147501-Pelagomonas_calceolata.AAC.2
MKWSPCCLPIGIRRYDASKTVDMKGRAAVALEAMKEAMKGLDPSISSKQAAQMGADAAEDAYDLRPWYFIVLTFEIALLVLKHAHGWRWQRCHKKRQGKKRVVTGACWVAALVGNRAGRPGKLRQPGDRMPSETVL